MVKVSNDEYTQKLFESAIEKMGLGNVFIALCNYVCDEDLSEFIGYYCDDHDCYPEDE